MQVRHILGSLALTLVLGPGASAAEPPALRLHMQIPPELAVGTRQAVPIDVELPQDAAPNLIVSAHATGRALEVVKGRWLRADTVEVQPGRLRFELPLVAVTPGAAIVRIEARAYRCSYRCETLAVAEEAPMRVRP